jgi:hypothetical protein
VTAVAGAVIMEIARKRWLARYREQPYLLGSADETSRWSGSWSDPALGDGP